MTEIPPRKRRRRSGRRQRRPSLDLDSSSSSSDARESVQASTQPSENARDREDSSSDESSAIFSSSEEEGPLREGKAKQRKASDGQAGAGEDAENGAEDESSDEETRELSISPPLFGFSASSMRDKPLLWGYVPGDNDHPEEEHPDYQAFRDYYLQTLVEHFGDELGALKEEVDSEDRLQTLVNSLASGADVFLSSDGPNPQREVVLQSMAAMREADSTNRAPPQDTGQMED